MSSIQLRVKSQKSNKVRRENNCIMYTRQESI